MTGITPYMIFFFFGFITGIYLDNEFPEEQKPKTEEVYSNAEICEAIYKIEGGEVAASPYGIKSVKCKGDGCQRVCENTVGNNRRRFNLSHRVSAEDFITFLAGRYCPTKGKLSANERALNPNWERNLRQQLKHNRKEFQNVSRK